MQKPIPFIRFVAIASLVLWILAKFVLESRGLASGAFGWAVVLYLFYRFNWAKRRERKPTSGPDVDAAHSRTSPSPVTVEQLLQHQTQQSGRSAVVAKKPRTLLATEFPPGTKPVAVVSVGRMRKKTVRIKTVRSKRAPPRPEHA